MIILSLHSSYWSRLSCSWCERVRSRMVLLWLWCRFRNIHFVEGPPFVVLLVALTFNITFSTLLACWLRLITSTTLSALLHVMNNPKVHRSYFRRFFLQVMQPSKNRRVRNRKWRNRGGGQVGQTISAFALLGLHDGSILCCILCNSCFGLWIRICASFGRLFHRWGIWLGSDGWRFLEEDRWRRYLDLHMMQRGIGEL